MTLQRVSYTTCQRLSCCDAGTLVVLCVDSSLVAAPACGEGGVVTEEFTYRTILGALVSCSSALDCRGQRCYTYVFTYDDAQLIEGALLASRNITGVICDTCLINWVREEAGNDVQLVETEPNVYVLISQHGCEYTLPIGQEYLLFSSPLVRVDETVSILQADAITDGFLDAADWVTFNAKADYNFGANDFLGTGDFTTTGTVSGGIGAFTTVNATDVNATNLNGTDLNVTNVNATTVNADDGVFDDTISADHVLVDTDISITDGLFFVSNAIRHQTRDGSDNKSISIYSGGGAGAGRGAYFQAHGNEHPTYAAHAVISAGNANSGFVDITAPHVSGSVKFQTAGVLRWTINSTGQLVPTSPPDYTVTNPSTLRSIDVSAATDTGVDYPVTDTVIKNILKILGTIIQDMQTLGPFQ